MDYNLTGFGEERSDMNYAGVSYYIEIEILHVNL